MLTVYTRAVYMQAIYMLAIYMCDAYLLTTYIRIFGRKYYLSDQQKLCAC